MKCNAKLGLTFGLFKVFLTSNGGIRVGANLGDTYISHKVKKPNRKKKTTALLSPVVPA
jgi:hypothetical protein